MFLNCDWGISPEQAIAALQDRAKTLKEDLSIKDEDKAIGLRDFQSDKKVEKIAFAEINWDFITLRFLDNKLARVLLCIEGLDGYKLREEFTARFGVLSHLDNIKGVMRIERWTAEDKSTLTLTMFDSVPSLGIKNVVMVSFDQPNFSGEVYKRSQELKKSKKSEWESPPAQKIEQSTELVQSGNKSFKFLNCDWQESPEATIAAIKESAGIVIKEIPKSAIEYEAEGLREYGIDGFEFEGYKWSLRLDFFDNKLFQVTLESKDVAHIDTVKLASDICAKYGHKYESFLGMPELREWTAADGSKLFLDTRPKYVAAGWKGPGYDEEDKKRRDQALKKKKTKS
jgi:hypothetical protein